MERVTIHDPLHVFFGNASLFQDLESLSLARKKILDVSAQRSRHDSASELDGIVKFIIGRENLLEVHVHNFYGPLSDATRLGIYI
jgi:hypothetical protein